MTCQIYLAQLDSAKALDFEFRYRHRRTFAPNDRQALAG